MTAATDSRNYNGLGTGLARDEVQLEWVGPIAANINLPSGTVAGALLADTATSPVLDSFVADGTMRALGFVRVGFDNTGGIQGARPIAVAAQSGKLVDANAGGGSAILQTDIFKPAYGVDNQTVSKLAAAGPCIGMLLGLDSDGLPVVLVDPTVAKILALATEGPSNDLIFDAATLLTIATGAVTATQSSHKIDTEAAAASDDLDTINGGIAEMVLFVRPVSGARTVVLKHNTGNIICPSAADISLADTNDFAMLYYANSKWTVVAFGLLAGQVTSATAPAFTGTAATTAFNVTPAFTGTGCAAAGQVITTTDNQTMTLNQCAGMLFVSDGTPGNCAVILSNTAVTGAPAVLTVSGFAQTAAGAYRIFKGATPVGTVASHTHIA